MSETSFHVYRIRAYSPSGIFCLMGYFASHIEAFRAALRLCPWADALHVVHHAGRISRAALCHQHHQQEVAT